MKKYDLHIHTKYSRCSNLDPKIILKTYKKLGYNGIAITDHNCIKGSITTSKLNKDKDFEVIIASEIKTNKAEIVALYLQEQIKTTDFFEVLDKLKDQDAIAIIAHPYSYCRSHLGIPLKKINLPLETYNGRAFPFENYISKKLAQKNSLAQIAGSDAHLINELGRGETLFEDNLRTAIKKRKTIAKGKQDLNILNLLKSTFLKWSTLY